MIRFATPADQPALVTLMQRAKMGCAWLTYGEMDGACIVEHLHGTLRGYIRFDLGRPETHIRQIVVDPEYQGDGLIARKLILAVATLAELHGAQTIEGFQEDDKPWLTKMAVKAGCQTTRGQRVRWPLIPTVSETARRIRDSA